MDTKVRPVVRRISTHVLDNPILAALNNPRVSEEAKEHARQELDNLEQSGEVEQVRQSYEEDKGRRL